MITTNELTIAAKETFSPVQGGFPAKYRYFEPALQKRLHMLLGGNAKGWLREIDAIGHPHRGFSIPRVDIGHLGANGSLDLVEVKVVEQYQKRFYGFEFPYFFYNFGPWRAGGNAQKHLQLRLQELKQPINAVRQDRLKQRLLALTPFQKSKSDRWISYTDDGAILFDMVKMLDFADQRKQHNLPCPGMYQMIFILTDPPQNNMNWQHVHDPAYLKQKLRRLYGEACRIATADQQFEVRSAKGKTLYSVPARGLQMTGQIVQLGAVSWQSPQGLVQRQVSSVILKLEETSAGFSCRFEPSQALTSSPVTAPQKQSLRYGVFDLETRKSAQQVGGWKNARDMQVSVAVLYDSADDRYHSYSGEQVAALMNHLQQLDLVVGFNIKRFDYKVLSGYTDFDFNSLPTFDLFSAIGNRTGLDKLASATLGTKKSAHGLQAVEWWEQGKLKELEDYCRQDVKITRDLFLHAQQGLLLKYCDKWGNLQTVQARLDDDLRGWQLAQ